jgi:hypothetical protein
MELQTGAACVIMGRLCERCISGDEGEDFTENACGFAGVLSVEKL